MSEAVYDSEEASLEGRVVAPERCPGARIMIIGEFPSKDDAKTGKVFSGTAGIELTRMLNEAGIARRDCWLTYVHKTKPPKAPFGSPDYTPLFTDRNCVSPTLALAQSITALQQEIDECNPTLILALGRTALWALTGETSVENWRGSTVPAKRLSQQRKMVVAFAPDYILRVWAMRAITVSDFRRALAQSQSPSIQRPAYNFHIPMLFEDALGHINSLYSRVLLGELSTFSVDIETIRHTISCVGIAWSPLDALCIPIRTSKEYWTISEEVQIVIALRRLMTHPKVKIIGQNFLYDIQYFARKWGYIPRVSGDTMLAQHVAFSGLPKTLAFISSMYCGYHEYWKDELKDYRKAPDDDMKYFVYNCKDCVVTWEAHAEQLSTLDQLNLREQYAFQMRIFYVVLDMMLRGVRIDLRNRSTLAKELLEAAEERRAFLERVIGYDLNVKSPKQMQQFLYNELGLPFIKNRKTKKVTANAEALEQLCPKWPILYPITDAILEQRSIGVFVSTFVQASLDVDNRMRCSYNPGGTETYRFSSSENAFGSGTNLQNIPDGSKSKTSFALPNVRKLFVPDPGYTIFDVDLDRADLQVVVWEADDSELKQLLRLGVDLHIKNGADLEDIDIPVDELIETHPNYPEHKKRYKKQRIFAKAWVHGTNYGGSPYTMAKAAGCDVRTAERMQRKWFALHPGIKRWHDRTLRELQTRRYVLNKFGFRRYYFDRIEALLPEALAWIPQSTVAIVTNKGMDNVTQNIPEIEYLLQVHDSQTGQYPTADEESILRRLHPQLLIPVPYDDPLVIPVGLKTSTISWGDCKDRSWPSDTTNFLSATGN